MIRAIVSPRNEKSPRRGSESGSVSNLVVLSGTPDVVNSTLKPLHLANPLSRSQRCFSQFDRKIDCFERCTGLKKTVTAQKPEVKPSMTCRRIPDGCVIGGRAPFKAVCGTQTRMPEGFNLDKINPGNICPITWWVASKDVDQTALTFVQVEHGNKPLESSVRTDEKPECGYREGYAEIPSRGS